jgi:nicotinamide mononucleotide transporter
MLESLRAMWPWEAIAVVSLLAYLVLAIRQNALCWPAAIIGTAIYVVLMFQVGLYMESALQLFYIGMAIYGWYTWRHGSGPNKQLLITIWSLAFNILPIAVIFILTLASGYLLATFTNAAMPYLDSFTTWAAVITTWMVARKILQNWHYWFVIDSVSVYLYVSRGLWLTAMLFVLYLILILIGYRAWLQSAREQAR